MNNHNVQSQLAVLGIDLAKQSFQLHGIGCNGNTVIKKKLSGAALAQFVAQLPVCTTGLEACSSTNQTIYEDKIQRKGKTFLSISLRGSRTHEEAVDLKRPIGANSIRAGGLEHLTKRPDM